MSPETVSKPAATRYYRKRVELFRLIDKIKLWPSRQGILHGIKGIEVLGGGARLTTHCGKTFLASNSRNSRAARWLRNKWFKHACAACGVPDWKLEKYASTRFRRHQGSVLREAASDGKTDSAEILRRK
jgi:pyrrolysyl-tRNA synthetase-like protein